jgi:protein TonB
MQGYVALKKKKNKLGKTLTIVAAIHLVVGGAMIWLAYSSAGRELMTVYKLTIRNIYEPPPPPPPEVKAPEPEPPPPPPPAAEEPKAPEPVQEASLPEPPAEITPPPEPSTGESTQVRLPGFGNSFGGGGKKGKFAGYADLVTVEIQRLYKQPVDLPDDSKMMVQLQILLEQDGTIVKYKVLKSSGNEKFDQSALQAVGKLQRLRPPPEGMSHTLVVKFSNRVVSS